MLLWLTSLLSLTSRERERSGRAVIFVAIWSRKVGITVGGAMPMVEPAEPDEGVTVPVAGAAEPDKRSAKRGFFGSASDGEVLDESESEFPLAAFARSTIS